MSERPVIEKTEKLLKVIKQYNVENNQSPEALFRPIRLGFSIFCTFKDLPAKFAKRRRAFSFGGSAYQKLNRLIVGHCHWLLSENQQDLIGVTLRTDITPSEGIGYGDKKAQLRRLEVQNRPEDVAWAKEKIKWLWRIALPSEPLPQIVLAEKVKLRDWDEYVDHGNYLPDKGTSTGSSLLTDAVTDQKPKPIKIPETQRHDTDTISYPNKFQPDTQILREKVHSLSRLLDTPVHFLLAAAHIQIIFFNILDFLTSIYSGEKAYLGSHSYLSDYWGNYKVITVTTNGDYSWNQSEWQRMAEEKNARLIDFADLSSDRPPIQPIFTAINFYRAYIRLEIGETREKLLADFESGRVRIVTEACDGLEYLIDMLQKHVNQISRENRKG